ncbi:cyclic diguanylate phosphodiesterase (EAL) domain protein [Synechococcus sp. PCC 7335]|nr:cyclic diguanylate phosphodiesterase (EAL) domain protein [Synechococcus sp. PCC 7335]
MSSSTYQLVSYRVRFFTYDLLSFYAWACSEGSGLSESVQGGGVNVHHPSAQMWQVNTLVLSYPAVGLGLLTCCLSVMLALLCLRIRRLTSLLKGKERCIKSILSIDALTGLTNRTALLSAGNRLLDVRPEVSVALLSIGIDHFKTVSDAFGFRVADELLRQVGQRIQTYLGSRDVLARTGDNEFSLLLSPGDEARSRQIADQILASIHQTFRVQSQLVHVQGRLGIAFAEAMRTSSREQRQAFDRSVFDCSELLLQANIAMTEGTPLGGDTQYAVFCPEMKAAIANKVGLQQSMSAAIEQQQLRVRYQAIVDIKTGRTVGFEALVRWQHPVRGLMRPDDFLPVAEGLGLTFKIDRWVLKKVCEQLVKWQAEGLLPSVSVNISGSHLCRSDLVEYIHELLAYYPVDPRQLNVEVTESVVVADLSRAIRTLLQLRSMGIGISLDDFGTGYSSLTYLQQFPVDVLKIDRSFVSRLGQSTEDGSREYKQLAVASSRQDELIVTSILTLASSLGICVVVEGIERLDQWQFLQKTCCGYVQGNYFSSAIEAERARSLL